MKEPFKFSENILVMGQKEDIEKAKNVLGNIPLLRNKTEPEARIAIQDKIDEYHLNAVILFKGNQVWSRRRVLNNLKRIVEKGTLYGGNGRVRWIRCGDMLCLPATPKNFKPVLSDYFYQFLIMCCGSSAHYSRAGWIGIYPKLEDLKRFFQRNEQDKQVSDWIPAWKTDALRIVEDIERTLYPFRSYLKAKQKENK